MNFWRDSIIKLRSEKLRLNRSDIAIHRHLEYLIDISIKKPTLRLYHEDNYTDICNYTIIAIEGVDEKGEDDEKHPEDLTISVNDHNIIYHIDITADPNLLTSKLEKLKLKGYPNYAVVMIPNEFSLPFKQKNFSKTAIRLLEIDSSLDEEIITKYYHSVVDVLKGVKVEKENTMFDTSLTDEELIELLQCQDDEKSFNFIFNKVGGESIDLVRNTLKEIFSTWKSEHFNKSERILPAREGNTSIIDKLRESEIGTILRFDDPFAVTNDIGPETIVGVKTKRGMKLSLPISLQDEEIKSRAMFKERSEENHSILVEIKDIISSEKEWLEYLAKPNASTSYMKDILFSAITCLQKNMFESLNSDTCELFRDLSKCVKTNAFAIAQHYRYIAESIYASMAISDKSSYKIMKNGPLDSVTLVKITGTTESFTKTHFKVFYKTEDNNIIKSEWIHVDKQKLNWWLKMPHVLTAIMSNYISTKYIVDDAQLKYRVSELTNLMLINRDHFAQVSELTRYFYCSSMGQNVDFSKLYDKMKFMRLRRRSEVIYLIRQSKMAIALKILRNRSSIRELTKGKDPQICFPDSKFVTKSFDEIVSSMYICNLYNKERAFQEIASAKVFYDLLEEEKIFRSKQLRNSLNLKAIEDNEKIDDIISDSLIHLRELLNNKQERFSGCIFTQFMLMKYLMLFKDKQKLRVGNQLNKITDQLSMTGGMTDEDVQWTKQAARSYSVGLEGVAKNVGKPSKFDDSITAAQHILSKESEECVSIEEMVNRELDNGVLDNYCYRIVPKDQKGHREISVLNFPMRLGTLYVENVTRRINSHFPVNVVEDKNKLYDFDKLIRSNKEEARKRNKIFFSDNSDQSRWGPNILMDTLEAMFIAILDRDSILSNVLAILNKMRYKKAKFPENLIEIKDKSFTNTVLGQVINYINISKNPYISLEWGMCQGIFQISSSNLHSMKMEIEDMILTDLNLCYKVSSRVTSDDAVKIFILDNLSSISKMRQVGVNLGKIFNIIRNPYKSFGSTVISEFNSVFYSSSLAVPTLKFCNSLIDCGEGNDYATDVLFALSRSGQSLAVGFNYVSALMLCLVNIIILIKQWRLEYERDYKTIPVEHFGLPIIEPYSILLFGPISNFWFRAEENGINHKEYSKIYCSKLTYFAKEMTEISRRVNGLSELKSSMTPGLSGVISMKNTNRITSRLMRRNRVNEWLMPVECFRLTDDRTYGDFLFNFWRVTSKLGMEQIPMTNKFGQKYSEPWVARDRRCYFYKGQLISLNELYEQTRGAKHGIENCDFDYPFVESLQNCLLSSSKVFKRIKEGVIDHHYDVVEYQYSRLVVQEIKNDSLSDFRNTLFKVMYKGPTNILKLPKNYDKLRGDNIGATETDDPYVALEIADRLIQIISSLDRRQAVLLNRTTDTLYSYSDGFNNFMKNNFMVGLRFRCDKLKYHKMSIVRPFVDQYTLEIEKVVNNFIKFRIKDDSEQFLDMLKHVIDQKRGTFSQLNILTQARNKDLTIAAAASDLKLIASPDDIKECFFDSKLLGYLNIDNGYTRMVDGTIKHNNSQLIYNREKDKYYHIVHLFGEEIIKYRNRNLELEIDLYGEFKAILKYPNKKIAHKKDIFMVILHDSPRVINIVNPEDTMVYYVNIPLLNEEIEGIKFPIAVDRSELKKKNLLDLELKDLESNVLKLLPLAAKIEAKITELIFLNKFESFKIKISNIFNTSFQTTTDSNSIQELCNLFEVDSSGISGNSMIIFKYIVYRALFSHMRMDYSGINYSIMNNMIKKDNYTTNLWDIRNFSLENIDVSELDIGSQQSSIVEDEEVKAENSERKEVFKFDVDDEELAYFEEFEEEESESEKVDFFGFGQLDMLIKDLETKSDSEESETEDFTNELSFTLQKTKPNYNKSRVVSTMTQATNQHFHEKKLKKMGLGGPLTKDSIISFFDDIVVKRTNCLEFAFAVIKYMSLE